MQTQSTVAELTCLTFNLATRAFIGIGDGARLPVADAWFVGNEVWLRLAEPSSLRVEDFYVVNAFAVDRNKYVILQSDVELATGAWQRHNVILKIVNPDTLATMDFEEFTRVSKEAAKPIDSEQLQLLLQSFLGYDIPNLKTNAEAKQLRENLANEIRLGTVDVPEGTELQLISCRRSTANDVYVRIAADDRTFEFLMPYVATIRNRDYGLLMYPPNMGPGFDCKLMVVVIHGATLFTVTLNELLGLTRRLIRVVQSSRRSHLAEFERYFGQIPEG